MSDESLTLEDIREAAEALETNSPDTQWSYSSAELKFESGSSIEYYEETPEIEYKPPVHERRLPGEEPNYELLNAVMRNTNRKVPLSIGGCVRIETYMDYDHFLRL